MSWLNTFRSEPIALLKPDTWLQWMSEFSSQLRTIRFSRNDPRFVPLCAILMLTLMLLLQLALPDRAAIQPDVRLPRIEHSPSMQLATNYPAIRKAPIFAPDRLPDPNDEPAANTHNTLALLGIAREGDRFVALIRGSDGSTHRVVGGGTIDGWLLTSADEGHVILERNGQSRVVVLTPGAQSKPAPAGEAAETNSAASNEDEDDSSQ
jgi:hypothetical protein